ncbi:FAD-dependent oxidoreductase [Cohnella zeiphila]|uniref:FAD-dependent oxidoreductase n=1 Tax=Cohnella zeiphila TaxID=2761120 RepID=A0A7X0SJ57_9BACL|nr:FAD-dependent oxidoreductase [Cohnella zeiphila]MBB6730948.1 FAD-dependent oxidoreductase [Cohnella zeiphila]
MRSRAFLSFRTLRRISLAALLIVGLAGLVWWKTEYRHRLVNSAKSQPLLVVQSADRLQDRYDVIVAGTDPEGVAAAVSAARNGLRVLLVDGRNRSVLGGLLTVGDLNMLDLNFSPNQPKHLRSLRKPRFLNKGIFQEWYDRVEGSAFDTTTAANAFYTLVKNEPNIDLLMHVRDWKPIVERENGSAEGRDQVTGMELTRENGAKLDVRSGAVIDATQDADIAAAAGAAFTFGREDIGDKDNWMASTLMIKLSGVTEAVWEKLGKHPGTGIDRMSLWGYPEAAAYPSSDPDKVRLRGLNIGRQDDGTLLINAMQLYGVDPTNPASVRQGLEAGEREAPLIVKYLQDKFPEFRPLRYDGTASELYTRESRHLDGEYRLSLADVMGNRSHWDDIAYGSYAIDIQNAGSRAPGMILAKPKQYGVPFRSLVPRRLDGLLVVGRSASFDSTAAGSARVVPLGMATGQAAGAAAKVAAENGLSFAQLSESRERISELRSLLVRQGMNLTMDKFKEPGYLTGPQYPGLLTAANLLLTSGGQSNLDWKLDEPTNPQRFANQLSHLKRLQPDRFHANSETLPGSIPADALKKPLTLAEAAEMMDRAAGGEPSADSPDESWLTPQTLSSIRDRDRLTNGDAFMLLRDFSDRKLGIRFD